MTKARILIVEDEAIIAMETESQLQSFGYAVTSMVDTGEKAIAKAETDKPDLILMDIRIKGEMDGIQAAEEIRDRFDIPVIFVTAYLDGEKIERAKITMPFGYVLKPIQERDLKVTIEMALYVAKVDAKRRKTEEALRESEQKYRTLFDMESDALALIDQETGKMLEVNKRFLDLYGYGKDEVLTMKNTDFSAEVEKTREATKIEKTVAPLRWHKKKDGTVFPTEIVANAFNYQQRNVLIAAIRDITERKLVEDALENKTHDLGERVKELSCLYGISELVAKPDISLKEIFQGIVNLIPPSWQYPNITCARLTIDNQEFISENFKESIWMQTANVNVHNKQHGILEVFYLEKKTEIDEGPFLKEERKLINEIAERLGIIIKRIKAEG